MLYFFYGEVRVRGFKEAFYGSVVTERLSCMENYNELLEKIRRFEFDSMKKRIPNITIDDVDIVIRNLQPL